MKPPPLSTKGRRIDPYVHFRVRRGVVLVDFKLFDLVLIIPWMGMVPRITLTTILTDGFPNRTDGVPWISCGPASSQSSCAAGHPSARTFPAEMIPLWSDSGIS